MSEKTGFPVWAAVAFVDLLMDERTRFLKADAEEVLPRVFEVRGDTLYATQRHLLRKPVEFVRITFGKVGE